MVPCEDTSISTITLKHGANAAKADKPEWKTQEYHGKQIHICTALHVHDRERRRTSSA